QDKTEAAVRETEEAVKALEEAVAEKTVPAAVSVTETATEITGKETEAVQDTGLQNVKMESPDVVVLENNKGEITMPHKEHGESFACETCHAENGPGPLSLGKEAGHKLCKGCHSEMQAGPTKCSECHKKTE
ncbi:MAG: cytochrome c3 family protein, partial [Desulfobulbales bacterium]|nr:cytochrome c3 family protein [Desulfobulbales bacterium]